MKPILAVVHVYYPEMWPELKECLNNITVPYELYVTTVESNENIKDDILKFKADTHFEIVANKGYDIGPFVHILNQVNLDDYSYLIKLHTKRNMPIGSLLNYFDISGDKWRKYALEPVSSKSNFEKCISSFEKDKELGMITNYHLILDKELDDLRAKSEVKEIFKNLSLESKQYGFVAGTMFMCRAILLKHIQSLMLTIDNFEIPNKNHSSSLAHTIERLIGCLVLAQKQKIADVLNENQSNGLFNLALRKLKLFLFRKKVNKQGKLIIKICKIPVYRRKLK